VRGLGFWSRESVQTVCFPICLKLADIAIINNILNKLRPFVMMRLAYLFTDESRGTYSRTQLFHIPGAGRLFPPAQDCFHRGPGGFSPGPGRLSSGARTAFLRGPDGFPPESDRPSFMSITVFLQARAVFLLLQDRLPPWPGRPTRERIPSRGLDSACRPGSASVLVGLRA
jgi:hypothetical protein